MHPMNALAIPSPPPPKGGKGPTKRGGCHACDTRSAQWPPVMPSENVRLRIRYFWGGISKKSSPPGPPQGPFPLLCYWDYWHSSKGPGPWPCQPCFYHASPLDPDLGIFCVDAIIGGLMSTTLPRVSGSGGSACLITLTTIL